jgi:hypothetical protein
MICFSRNDIERISRGVIDQYRHLPELQGMNITKIDPRLLAENLLGLTLDFVHLSLTGDTLGLTCLDETGVEVYDEADQPYIYILDGHTILVESDLRSDCEHMGRCNFSVMHEASHQLFGMLYPKEYGPDRKGQLHFYKPQQNRKAIKNWEEWQANTLASALLMPEDILRSNMQMFGLGERIEVLNSRYRQEEFTYFFLLAEYMGVSKQALAIRMKQLNLLDKEYLNRANEMFAVYKED